ILLPRIGIPASSGKIIIDGTPNKEEWQRSAGVTGLYTLDGALTSRQTSFRVTWDNENLYVLLEAPYERSLAKGSKKHDFNMRECDTAEIYLKTGADAYHILINPAGGTKDFKNRDASWNGKIQYAATIVDSGETRGGVLTFAKGTWYSEVAIPFSTLGSRVPKEGDAWQANFSRDFLGGKGGNRTSDDWTTLVYNRNLSRPDKLATLVFGSEIPALQIRELGQIQSGAVSIKGTLFSAESASVDVQVACLLAGSDNMLLNRSESFDLVAGRPAELTINDKISSDQVIQARMIISAKDKESGELFYQLPINFESTSSFEYKARYNMSEKKLVSLLDLKNITESPANLTARIGVKDSAGKTMVLHDVAGINQQVVDVSIPLADVPVGDYIAECELLDASGKRLSMAVSGFAVEPPPAWIGNAIGMDGRLPPPFEPVQVEGRKVGVLLRDYTFANSGLPEQISAAGKNLFAKPPAIKCVMNGSPVQGAFDEMTVVSKADGRIVFALKGRLGSVPVSGELSMEFDGFAEWTLTLPATEGVTIEALSLEFYYTPERALYARAANGADEKRFRAALYADETTAPEEIGGFFFAKGGFPWTGEFQHELFICDDERGFYVMNESAQYLIGKKRVEIEKTAGLVTVKYNLVSKPCKLDHPLPYQLFWLATPVKPLPDDAKKWNMCFGGDSGKFSQETKTQLYVRMLHLVTPNLYNIIPPKKQALMKKERGAAVHTVPYWSIGAGPLGTEEFDKYDPVWEALPVAAGTAGNRGGWKCACTRSPVWRDFVMNNVRILVEQYGVDGVYLDVSRAQGCRNPVHGCGYYDPQQKKRIPTVNIKGTRELFKRLYTYLKSSGKDRVIFLHGINPGSIGFCDTVSQGESWHREGEKMYDRLTPDVYRTVVMRNMLGLPFEYYPFFYSWRAQIAAKQEPVSSDEMFMLGLPFYTRPAILGLFPNEIANFWALTNPWWTDMDFIGYWRAESPLSVDNEHIYASTYRKHGGTRAMLGVSNFSWEDQTVTITVDQKKLGFPIRGAQVINPVGGEKESIAAANKIQLRIPARSGRMVVLEP
ncbi:MAG: DUF6067 family protein, partial [Kiritimatiellales bacterium]|nr:DUF6067 family protein [Kiritimatiellales bacterium]